MIKENIDIIVVDDDPDLCLLMFSMLKFANYNVRKCDNPIILNNFLEQYNTKAIVMDMLLSGKDGRDFCRKFKTDEQTKHINIMMVSAHPDAEQTCKDAGANEFLSKPFDMDVFLEKVAKLMS